MPAFVQELEFNGIDNVSKTVSGIIGKVNQLSVVSSDLNKQFANVTRTGSVLASKIRNIALVATGAATALFWMAYRTSDAAEDLLNLSQKTGVSVIGLQKLNATAELTGINTESMAMAFTFLNRSMNTAATDGASEAAQAFSSLGIDLLDAQGKAKDTETVFYELAESFSKAADGPAKVQTAVKLFGRAGANLIPLLNFGSAAIRQQGEEASKYLNIIDKEGLLAIGDFGDVVESTIKSVKSLGSVIAQVLIPYLQPLVKYVGDWVSANRELFRIKITEWVRSLVQAFTEFLPKLQTAWLQITKVWDAIGGLTGVLKILAAFMAGNLIIALGNFVGALLMLGKVLSMTPIGRFITLLGLVATAVAALNHAFPELGETIASVADYIIKKFAGAFEWITEKINGLLDALGLLDQETSKIQGKAQPGGKIQQTLVDGKVVDRQYLPPDMASSQAPISLDAGQTTPTDGGFGDILKMIGNFNAGGSKEPMKIAIALDTSNRVENIDIDAPLTTDVSVNSGPMLSF